MKSLLALPLAAAAHLVAPTVAHAQTQLQAPWGGTADLPPPPPLEEPRFQVDTRDDRPTWGARVGYEMLGGVSGAVAGSLLTVGGACVLAPRECPDSSREFGEALLLSSVTNLLTIPLGVTIAGNLASGDGGFGWAFLGSLSGMVVAIPGAALVAASGGSSSRGARYAAADAFLTLLPMAGSILAYELSVSSRTPTRRIERGARVVPMLDVHARGASAGATIVF